MAPELCRTPPSGCSHFSPSDDNPSGGGSAATGTFGFQHTSLEAGDTTDQKKADVKTLFSHAREVGNVVLTGTEAGTEPMIGLIKNEASAKEFYCHIAGDSWVCVDKRWATKKVENGWTKVVDSGSGHSARGVTWMTVETPYGQMSIAAMHLLTAKSSEQEPNANPKMKDAAVAWAKEHGPLSFIGADVNASDKTKNVWGSSALTTCWDELKKWPDTHEGGPSYSIDVLTRLTSGPAKFSSARALADSDVKLNADHKLIEGTVKL